MPERLYEFNRLELARRLTNDEETRKLVVEVQSIVKKAFPDRYVKY